MRPLIIIRRRTTRALARLRDQHRRLARRAQAYQAAIWFGADRETAESIADCVR